MSEKRQLQIRPYARLLTMLGEQLIKNERIALIELIKNSYDADADWVKVSFINFGDEFEIHNDSRIVIEDNGCGMNLDTIEKHWLNPATPEKIRRKKIRPTTKKGRTIQGEKGIGRFAILKLGRNIEIISKTHSCKDEHIINYNFSEYDDDFLSLNGEDKNLFLDELRVSITSQKPNYLGFSTVIFGSRNIKRSNHGTIITIMNLKGSWSSKKVESVFKDLTKLESIFKPDTNADFEVAIYKDSVQQNFQEKYLEKLKFLLTNRAVFRIEDGVFDDNKNEFRYRINGNNKVLSIFDPYITGLKPFRDRFNDAGMVLKKRPLECGSFNFGFYIFDFSAQASAKYLLDREDKNIIKDHRIYLYRDNIRVYPYGDPDDDWLRIDAYRGTVSAGQFLSNDQVVGFIYISQSNNPKLRDKTNREGLIDEGNATEDFIAIIQTFLAYTRRKEYAIYRENLITKSDHTIYESDRILQSFDKLKKEVTDNPKLRSLVNSTEKDYNAERRYLIRRAETTEELAGVGLSVETASHDIMSIMAKVYANLDAIIRDIMTYSEYEIDVLLRDLQSIRGGISFIESQLKDIQLLFKSSKQRRKNIKVRDILDKVVRIYDRILKKENITLNITTTGSPLIAKTTDAVLLQLFLNLFDNAVYWLMQTDNKPFTIDIQLDGQLGKLIFSDNGPGIDEDDAPYIFEPFFSGKGEEGRGLGLYIAKQLLERNDYSIHLAEIKSEKHLSGANFVVSFITEDS